jgi:hypothetical protein
MMIIATSKPHFFCFAVLFFLLLAGDPPRLYSLLMCDIGLFMCDIGLFMRDPLRLYSLLMCDIGLFTCDIGLFMCDPLRLYSLLMSAISKPYTRDPRHPHFTLHPTPYTPYPTPYTLHPTPYTLHPIPYTLHPTPYTLHPTPQSLTPVFFCYRQVILYSSLMFAIINLKLSIHGTDARSLGSGG